MEEALAAFRTADDPAGVYLSWAGIVDSYSYNFGEWDNLDKCIEIFNDLQKTYPFPASGEIDLIVSSRILILLILRKMEETRPILYWFGRISRLLQKNAFADIYLLAHMFFMSTYYLWKGEYNSNALLLEKAVERLQEKSSPLSVISVRLMTGIHYWVTAQYDAAVKLLTEGLAVAEESGVYNYNSLLWSFLAAVNIATGNKAAAEADPAKAEGDGALHIQHARYVLLPHQLRLAGAAERRRPTCRHAYGNHRGPGSPDGASLLPGFVAHRHGSDHVFAGAYRVRPKRLFPGPVRSAAT